MHEEHRHRVRMRFLSEGLLNLPPHNVLELLLFYSIPRRDTNEIAHRLIKHFGTLTGVLEAPYEELCKVAGIGENSAVLIMLISQLAKRYIMEQSQEKITLNSSRALHEYVCSQFIGLNNETAFLICLNNANQLLHCSPISLGTKYTVSLDNRTLLETAFRHNATKVVLAHNHPNGLAAPSQNDIVCTQAALKLFRNVNISLLDHLIVAEGKCFSMAGSPRWGRIFLATEQPLQQAADIS